MSRVYLGTNPVALARLLGRSLGERLGQGDPFEPITLVVPNPQLGKWLRLFLARDLGAVMNVRITFLEQALWEMFREIDPRHHAHPPELLDGDLYRFLVLSVLMEHDGPQLSGLRAYLGLAAEGSPSRWRRAWQLADRLSGLIRDYEYHRRDALILPWLAGQPARLDLSPRDRELEQAQATLFREIIREPLDSEVAGRANDGGIRSTAGKRAQLNAAAHRNYKTLPQYAGEVMDTSPPAPSSPRRSLHLFGVTQLSALHVRALAWLAPWFDLQTYFLSPFAAILKERHPAADLRQAAAALQQEPDLCPLLRRWGRAGLESLSLLGGWVQPGGPAEPVYVSEPSGDARAHGPGAASVLSALQASLMGGTVAPRVPQDRSLQIIGCPGIQREVEVVYDSIVNNLQADPSLRATDVAVLVTDMATYRPALEAAFERHPSGVGYSLVDHSAEGVSLWGRAFVGMLALAQGDFRRADVFAVVLNPCFLERLGVERSQAEVWLHWAHELGVHHGWDADERQGRGEAASNVYGWRQALQRLRLGRYMTPETDPFAPAAAFRELVPHADIHSSDREQLDGFCRAIEGLLPSLIAIRSARQNGTAWAQTLGDLAQRFLDVPADRPAEAQVRDALLASLEQLVLWDKLHGGERERARMPLALVEQFVRSGLRGISASRGSYLTEGVTISALQPMRPVPFRIIYVLGLNEGLFPGRNVLSSLDLRSHGRVPGDVLPAEQNLYLLLEVVLAAQDRLYLMYNCRDLQKDRELLPASPVSQLERHLKTHVVEGRFQTAEAPLRAEVGGAGASHCDAFAPTSALSRGLAIEEGMRRGTIVLTEKQRREWERWNARRPSFKVPPGDAALATTLKLRDLREFLLNPARAMLDTQLRVQADDGEVEGDAEPFVTSAQTARDLQRRFVDEAVRRHRANQLPGPAEDWLAWLEPPYEHFHARCQTPVGAFREVDFDYLKEQCRRRIEGENGLQAFLQSRPASSAVGPVLIGESHQPIRARLHYPALELGLASADARAPLRLIGHHSFLWWREGEALDLMAVSYSSGMLKSDRIGRPRLDSLLFCLALLAKESASVKEGPSSADLVRGIPWNLHVLHSKGLSSCTIPADAISAVEARDYLAALAGEYLGSQAFDLMPWDVIVEEEVLFESAVGAEGSLPLTAEAFQQALEAACDAAREFRSPSWDSALLGLLDPGVPADALAKARRRMGLLHRGLRAASRTPETARSNASPRPRAKPGAKRTRQRKRSGKE